MKTCWTPRTHFHEIKSLKPLSATFDLMTNAVMHNLCYIMVKIVKWSWDQKFFFSWDRKNDHEIERTIMRSKERSWDRKNHHEIESHFFSRSNFDPPDHCFFMRPKVAKKWLLISWLFFQSHEKKNFWSHDHFTFTLKTPPPWFSNFPKYLPHKNLPKKPKDPSWISNYCASMVYCGIILVRVETIGIIIVGIRRQLYRFDFSQQLPDIFYPIFYDTFYKAWLHFESAWLGLIYIGICGSIVVILLQGCIFDACGSYHIMFSRDWSG